MEVRRFVLPGEHNHHLKLAGRIEEDQTATALRQEMSHSVEGVEPSDVNKEQAGEIEHDVAVSQHAVEGILEATDSGEIQLPD